METQASTTQVSVAKGVDSSKLEKELARMWAGMSESNGAGQSAGVVRACVLNLIVYAATQQDRAEVDELLEAVIGRHPCRAIVIVADRDAAEARLDAYVSTRCKLSAPGAKQICGEQITIEAGGPVVDTASTAVTPLLIPDVPVFLWWKDIPDYTDKLFDRLTDIADRVIIDSASFDRPHKDFLRLAEILKGGELRLSDINWGRLTSWRSLVAGFWDVSDYRASLGQIEKVRIEYDPPDHAHEEIAPKALLALGWVASCLGWEAEGEGSKADAGVARFNLRTGDGRAVIAELVATDDVAGRDGMITSLTISTATGDEFYVALRWNESKLETGVRQGGDGHAVGRVLNYGARTEGERLSCELDILTHDRIYEQSVAAAAGMLASVVR
ncbi:MAG TPA: glucose-6-phosphate dehydrogenase assembly protein OpcA [Pyrinomonadaceae bacterium]|nr:glucose-6-phosphate dehydrogenase assembly protein OpcA [Pyrinomonadaceae bacterium]